jgi:hypothetical protein
MIEIEERGVEIWLEAVLSIDRPTRPKGPSQSVWLILRSGLVGLPWSTDQIDQIDGLPRGGNWM